MCEIPVKLSQLYPPEVNHPWRKITSDHTSQRLACPVPPLGGIGPRTPVRLPLVRFVPLVCLETAQYNSQSQTQKREKGAFNLAYMSLIQVVAPVNELFNPSLAIDHPVAFRLRSSPLTSPLIEPEARAAFLRMMARTRPLIIETIVIDQTLFYHSIRVTRHGNSIHRPFRLLVPTYQFDVWIRKSGFNVSVGIHGM